jgi:hypothetical protein
MTDLLLDHPWRLDESLDPNSNAFEVLLHFEDLVRETRLGIVPFVSRTDFDEMWQRIEYSRYGPTRAYASLARFAGHLVRDDSPGPLATPVPEPELLSQTWKRGLREAMGDLRDWRNPQIIVPIRRRSLWPAAQEVPIQVEDRGGVDVEYRLLVRLEGYSEHPFVVADFDPWDLLQSHPPGSEAGPQHPCRLPRPPLLAHVPFERLTERLAEARNAGSRIGGRLYFIPPSDWRPEHADKPTWRGGRAFQHEYSAARPHPGPIDHEGRVWVWDRVERHWDVQERLEYVRVSHTGEPL